MKKALIALALLLGLASPSSAQEPGPRTSDRAIAVAIGAGTAYGLGLVHQGDLGVDPREDRIMATLYSLGAGLLYEVIRKEADHEPFDMGNAYASALGTLGVVTFRF